MQPKVIGIFSASCWTALQEATLTTLVIDDFKESFKPVSISLSLISGMYFDHPEIIPSGVQGDFRFNKAGERVSRFASKEAEVRALIEGQFMAKKLHAEKMGFQMSKVYSAIINIRNINEHFSTNFTDPLLWWSISQQTYTSSDF